MVSINKGYFTMPNFFKFFVLIRRGLLLSLLLALAGCANQITYQDDFNTAEDFAGYKTYSWHEPNEHNHATQKYLASDLVDQRIRDDIDAQLLSKGFTKTAEADADFYVNYTVTVGEDLEVKTYNTYGTDYNAWGYGNFYNYRGSYGSPYRYYSTSYPVVKTGTQQELVYHKVGTFVIDIVNAESGKLIWRGTAESTINKKTMAAQERDAKIAEIVEKTLHGYPPTAAATE